MTHYLPPDYEQLRDRCLAALDAARLIIAKGEVDETVLIHLIRQCEALEEKE